MFELSESFNEEFKLQVNQLKRFTTHGPSLGRYIEILLLNLLKKYFPELLGFSSGFLYSMNRSLPNRSSSQIDIMCYDRINNPILFKSSDLVIVPPQSIKGMIEVKSTLRKNSIKQILKLSKMAIFAEVPREAKIFLLSIKSELSASNVFTRIKEHCESNNDNEFIGSIYSLSWSEILFFRNEKIDNEFYYSGFQLKINKNDMAPFISTLLFHLYGSKLLKSVSEVLIDNKFKCTNSFSIKKHI